MPFDKNLTWKEAEAARAELERKRLAAAKPPPVPAPPIHPTPPANEELQRLLDAWPDMSLADRHQAAAGQGLQNLMAIVSMPFNGDLRQLKLQAEVSKFLVANQTKIDEATFKAKPRDRTDEIIALAEKLGLTDAETGDLLPQSPPRARIAAEIESQSFTEAQEPHPELHVSPPEVPPVLSQSEAPPVPVVPLKAPKPIERYDGSEYTRRMLEHIDREPAPKEDRSYQTIDGRFLVSAPWLYRNRR